VPLLLPSLFVLPLLPLPLPPPPPPSLALLPLLLQPPLVY